MKIPKRIKIGNLTYTVSQLLEDDKDTYYGSCSSKYQWIKLDFKQLSEEHVAETFIHEIVHIILDQKNFMEESKNERLISTLANGLYQVFKDNHLLK